MKNEKIILLSLLFVFILCIGAVSAHSNDTDTAISDDQNVIEHDTISVENNEKTEGNLLSSETPKEKLNGESGNFTELQNLIDNNDEITLDKDYINNDINGLSIGKSITINGNNHIIDGNKSDIIYISTDNEVIIKNTVFRNWNSLGSCIESFAKGTLKMYNCTFKDWTGMIQYAGGLIYEGRIMCISLRNTYLENCSCFNINSGREDFYIGGDNITINNCNLTYMTLQSKGINIINNSRIKYVSHSGGHNNNTLFYNSSIETLNWYSDPLNVKNCLIKTIDGRNTNLNIENSNITYVKGHYQTNFTISNSRFSGAEESALQLNTGNAKIVNCSFIGNNASKNNQYKNGGAINLDENSTAHIEDCHFINNTAKYYGGAIYAHPNAKITIINSEYINNHAGIDGDDISKQEINLKDEIYVSPTGQGQGTGMNDLANLEYAIDFIENNGKIYLTSGTYTTKNYLEINTKQNIHLIGIENNVEFYNISLDIQKRNIEIKNIIFKNCQKSAITTAKYNCTIHNCTFINCSDEYGYVIRILSIKCNISNNIFINNTLPKQQVKTEYSFTDLKNDVNPPIYISNIDNNIFNNTIDPPINNIELTHNYTWKSGDTNGYIPILRDNLTINGNGYTFNTKGQCKLFIIAGDNVTLMNMIITGGWYSNYGTLNGTLIWNGKNGKLINVTFINNKQPKVTRSSFGPVASAESGALYITGDNMVISNCTFINNTAGHSGGAVHINGGNNCTILNSKFINNTIHYEQGHNGNTWNMIEGHYTGGAVYINNAEKITILNSTFINNTAGNTENTNTDGGAIYINNVVYCDINNCKFTNNSAHKNGGAICTENTEKISIKNSIFSNNPTRYKATNDIYIQNTKTKTQVENINNTRTNGSEVNIEGTYTPATNNGTPNNNTNPNNQTTPTNETITLTGINLNVLYSGKAIYKVQVLNNGKNIADGTKIQITYNGKTYSIQTTNGTATITLPTTNPINKYTITAQYNKTTTTNTLTIKNIIKTNNLKIKKSKKINKIKISLTKVDGKYLTGKKITLKIKGKKITTAKTNKKGTATLKIKKNQIKKLKKGTTKATITYDKNTITKQIKITK